MSQATELSFLTTSTGVFRISSATQATSTTTGALQVAGGVGIGGNLFVGGSVTATNIFIGPWAVSTGSTGGGGGGTTVETSARTTNATHYLTFVTDNNAAATAESVYTTSSFVINPGTGDVGIGTTSPTSALHVAGDARITGITTISNTLFMGGNIINNPLFTSYKEFVSSSTVAASTTIDLSLSNVFRLTMTTSITSLTFSNPPASGTAFSFMMYCQQDATGNRTIAWPASVKWPNGSAPTMTTTANKIDIFNFFTLDGGTSYIGALSLGNV